MPVADSSSVPLGFVQIAIFAVPACSGADEGPCLGRHSVVEACPEERRHDPVVPIAGAARVDLQQERARSRETVEALPGHRVPGEQRGELGGEQVGRAGAQEKASIGRCEAVQNLLDQEVDDERLARAQTLPRTCLDTFRQHRACRQAQRGHPALGPPDQCPNGVSRDGQPEPGHECRRFVDIERKIAHPDLGQASLELQPLNTQRRIGAGHDDPMQPRGRCGSESTEVVPHRSIGDLVSVVEHDDDVGASRAGSAQSVGKGDAGGARRPVRTGELSDRSRCSVSSS